MKKKTFKVKRCDGAFYILKENWPAASCETKEKALNLCALMNFAYESGAMDKESEIKAKSDKILNTFGI